MAMMYATNLARSDVLLATSFLVTKSQRLNDADYNNVLRVLAHLKETSSYGITIKCTELTLHLHCNASGASHHDGKSHTGWILKMEQSNLGCNRRDYCGFVNKAEVCVQLYHS